jgi:hypothetical protein
VLAVLDDGSVVTCHFTTCHRGSDRACVIKAGEHPFFTKPETCVRYDQVQVLSEEALEALERLITKRLEPLRAELLERVRQGALTSAQTPDKVKNLLKK